MWERSFVAMTVLAGGTTDEAIAALTEDGARRASDVLAKLRDPKRPVRAAMLAEMAKDVVVAIDQVTLR
jgi:hypothetical protein